MKYNFEAHSEFARHMDEIDPLSHFRDQFYIPQFHDGQDAVYFCGNSLGLQPKEAPGEIRFVLEDWQNLAVRGHSCARVPWMEYTEPLKRELSNMVGAIPEELAIGNTLTVNLHLLLISFYRPTKSRFKILMESKCFPSDRYAVISQLGLHGYSVEDGIIEVSAENASGLLDTNDFIRHIEFHKDELALILLGGINYYSGQLYDLKSIAEAAKKYKIAIGLDLAHVAGNVPIDLNDIGADFACWCTYKYLNGGPGSLGAFYIDKKYHKNMALPRLEGWWGNKLKTRFAMEKTIDPWPGAEKWIISNPPILAMAPLVSSLKIFAEAKMEKLRRKSMILTSYLEFLLRSMEHRDLDILTPAEPDERGCQLSLYVNNCKPDLFDQLKGRGIIVDWRNPGVIRVAPVPLYNSFSDVYRFYEVLKISLGQS